MTVVRISVSVLVINQCFVKVAENSSSEQFSPMQEKTSLEKTLLENASAATWSIMGSF